MKQTVIKEYIRNSETKQPRGIALAIRVGDEVFYGYSLLNTTMDKFSKDLGTKIATKRAMSPSYQLPKVPDREAMVLNAFSKLEKRALKYFKDVDPSKVQLCPSNIESPYVEE
jgi:hypothetical protein